MNSDLTYCCKRIVLYLFDAYNNGLISWEELNKHLEIKNSFLVNQQKHDISLIIDKNH